MSENGKDEGVEVIDGNPVPARGKPKPPETRRKGAAAAAGLS
jgi:hypothetical protein